MSEPAERVIKRAIAKVLNEKGELDEKAIRDFVKNETGHGGSKTKTYVDEMVGAKEVAKRGRELPKKLKTTYILNDKGRERIRA